MKVSPICEKIKPTLNYLLGWGGGGGLLTLNTLVYLIHYAKRFLLSNDTCTFLSKNYKTGIIILHQKYYINYNYITITIFIIYCLYSYHNRWQLASENLIGTLCVVSGHFVFYFYIFLCLGNMFSIILCTMSNKTLPYHIS